MATSKTIGVTNVTVQVPEFTDQPDQRVNSNCIDKIIDGINSLSDQIGNLFAYKEYSIPIGNIGSYSTRNGTQPISVTGYVPYSVRGYELSDDHLILTSLNVTSTYVYYSVKNYDSSAVSSVTLKVRVAYVKSPATVTELT